MKITRIQIVIISASLIALLSLFSCLIICINQNRIIKEKDRFILMMNDDEQIQVNSKYDFIDSRIGCYIESLCYELELDSNLVFGILMQENPMFDSNAVNKNGNGTLDVGLFQLNDRYLWNDFEKRYWIDGVELDPFNWKHNCYIAVHHISHLQKTLKVNDDVIMAYNCGMTAVMKDRVPEITRRYLANVRNNIHLLKEIKDDD